MIHFYFDEVDVELTGWEMLKAVLLGVGICAAPFVVKIILLTVHFGGI